MRYGKSMVNTLTLRELVQTLDAFYPPQLAEPWDKGIGLSVGDYGQEIKRAYFCLDPVTQTIAEAISWGADIVITHHPLLFSPVHRVNTDTPGGRIVHSLIKNNCAHYSAHTNGDSAQNGVNDALAELFDLQDAKPLIPAVHDLEKIVAFIPDSHSEKLITALADAGCGALGNYERCAWKTVGEGTFQAKDNAQPYVGNVGEVTRVAESRIEMIYPAPLRRSVVSALKANHPYEEPAFDVLALAPVSSEVGLGRIGDLVKEMRLGDFAKVVAGKLPKTVGGITVSGDLDRIIRKVAVLGGSGQELIGVANDAGADVFLTSDLKHHGVIDQLELGGLGNKTAALINAPHFATESPWLALAARKIQETLRRQGFEIETKVSAINTDPWQAHYN